MSYDARLLFEKISASLHENPCRTLKDLSQDLHVSERTIQKAVILSTGRSFRFFRDEVIVTQLKSSFVQRPEVPIKELAFSVGFKSASAFARAIKRASGLSPEEFRSKVGRESTHTRLTDYGFVNQAFKEKRQRIRIAGV